MKDLILVITVLGIMVFGFFVMKRLDKFIKKNFRPYPQDEDDEEDTSETPNE